MNGYLKKKLVSQVEEIIELSRYSGPFIAKACDEGSF